MRRLSATILAASFGLFVVFAFVLQVPVTFAQERAVVQDVSGSATVLRDGSSLPVSKGFELHEGDVLQTGSASKVSVTYFDRSFSRFFEGSRAVFQRLASDDFGAQHSVDIVLQQGSVWSNIFDFVSSSKFRMQARDFVTLASQRATFSLTAGNGETALEVYDHTVKVELPSKKEGRTIDQGFSVVANRSGDSVKPLRLASTKRAWVQENLAQDQKLLAENEKHSQGVVVGPSNALEENASLLLAFDASERFRLQLSIAERGFYTSLRADPFDTEKNQAALDALKTLVKNAPANDEPSKKLAEASISAALAAENVLLAQQQPSGTGVVSADPVADSHDVASAVGTDSAAVSADTSSLIEEKTIPSSTTSTSVPPVASSSSSTSSIATAPSAASVPPSSVTPAPQSVSSKQSSRDEDEKPVPLPPKLQISQDEP